MAIEQYEGGCHCGRVRFRVRGDLKRAAICNCSICQMKGIIHLIVEKKDFDLLSGQDDLSDYQFNTKTAHHYFCRICGIHSYYVPRSHPDGIDVNVRCLQGVNLDDLRPLMFDGRHWEQAIESLRASRR